MIFLKRKCPNTIKKRPTKRMKDIFVSSVDPQLGVWKQISGNGSLQVPLQSGRVLHVLSPL